MAPEIEAVKVHILEEALRTKQKSSGVQHAGAGNVPRAPLYTPEERLKRDQSGWTLVQGILAPLQFLAFVVSLVLILNSLITGQGLEAAHLSVVVKTFTLYTIMITGCLWEKAVFGRYLFAPAFFWEDVFSMLVLALHTAYLVALWQGSLSDQALLKLALSAYATYIINAGQFLIKLRTARLDAARQVHAQAAPGSTARVATTLEARA